MLGSSARLRLDITAGPGGFVCEWTPDIPRTLTGAQLRRYRAARDSVLGELGRSILCLEPDQATLVAPDGRTTTIRVGEPDDE